MAYVVVLLLVLLLTTLGLTFLNQVGTQRAATANRLPGMQAEYLAESAANHAMWRLLNEPAFPAAADKYYMHSLAGGRYGYKVRRHTDTTFATVATVGAMGESVVKQSYVLYVKPLKGSGLLFVVADAGNLNAQDLAKQALIESWGYGVEFIDVHDSQSEFDAAVARSAVVFITEDINSGDLNTKLVATTIGVVSEEVNLSDTFGISSTVVWESGTSLNLVNNTHFITSPFALGGLTVFASVDSLAYVSGTLSPDLSRLGNSPSGPALVALDQGMDTYDGRTAAGRRVLLPWGGDNQNVNNLTADGQTIMQRAIEWAAGFEGQEVTLYPSADTYVKYDKPNDNLGGVTESKLRLNSKPWWSLVRFDVSSIDSGTVLKGATLRLYVTTDGNPAGTTVTALRVTEDWAEFEATWNDRLNGIPWATPGGTYSTTGTGSGTTAGGTGYWLTIDITAMAQGWVNGSTPNYGGYLKANKTKEIRVATKEYGTTADIPRLVIRY